MNELTTCQATKLSELLRQYAENEQIYGEILAKQAQIEEEVEFLKKVHENVLTLMARALQENNQFGKKLMIRLDGKSWCIEGKKLERNEGSCLPVLQYADYIEARCIVEVSGMVEVE